MTKIFSCTAILFFLTLALPAVADVAVRLPQDGENVSSPFHLIANAPNCNGQTVGIMGYAIDSGQATMLSGWSINTQVTASSGTHTLHVLAWGSRGSECDTDVVISVGGTSTPPTGPPSGGSGISVSSPADGSDVSSPFNLVASASTCSSQSVLTMGYSLDGSSNTEVVSGTSINAEVTSSSGQHTLHVKAWAGNGIVCVSDVDINVGGSGSSGGGGGGSGSGGSPSIPSDAVSVSGIQAQNNWQATADSAAGSGIASGSTYIVASPSQSGQARKFSTSYVDNGAERYSVRFGSDASAKNFFYDGWVYLTGSSSQISNLEMDVNQTISNGQTVVFGFQCDGYSGTWAYTANAGTPGNPIVQWVKSAAPCNVRNWSTYTWHHVQVSYSRDDSGNVSYNSVWLDGAEEDIGVTVPSAFALGWDPTLVTNFQVDGLGASGSSVVYLDNLTISRW